MTDRGFAAKAPLPRAGSAQAPALRYSGITRDTLDPMPDVSIRELRNHGGEVVDRVARGERLTVTRNGRPVAELRPVVAARVDVRELIRRRSNLPPVDPDRLRHDIDSVVDPAL